MEIPVPSRMTFFCLSTVPTGHKKRTGVMNRSLGKELQTCTLENLVGKGGSTLLQKGFIHTCGYCTRLCKSCTNCKTNLTVNKLHLQVVIT